LIGVPEIVGSAEVVFGACSANRWCKRSVDIPIIVALSPPSVAIRKNADYGSDIFSPSSGFANGEWITLRSGEVVSVLGVEIA
jgi:hypothetical protein